MSMISCPQMGKTLLNALLAGIFIGIAGTVCLACPIPVLGAFLFSFGLLMILCNGFKLYTGAIGYLVNQGRKAPSYLVTLVLIWIGNLAGCWAVGTALRATRSCSSFDLAGKAAALCTAKLGDSASSLLILAFFCGILMYLAVDTFRREDLPSAVRLITVILCVSVFILSGFEHCIANMYYFSVAGMWSGESMLAILLMTFGNSLGGWFLPAMDKIRH